MYFSKCHCQWYIYRASKRAERVLGHRAKFGQHAKFRQCSGHKAIKESEKPFWTEFNQSKAKRNDNCSKLTPNDPHHSRVNSTSASEPTLSPPASKRQSKQYLHQNLRHLTFWILDYKKVTCTKHDSVFLISNYYLFWIVALWYLARATSVISSR